MFITFMCDPFPSSCFSSGLYRALQSRHSTLFFSDGSEDDVVSNEPSKWRMKTAPGKSYRYATCGCMERRSSTLALT
ncbi:hypothetical protein BS47DRAFT_1355317 [Hydnum rufescens UP504]|uniref:Uncharacterized protein n=1 Tax=Hydnum rufescens UP504 TaxID=1448309 RepID=A0A9P6DFC9_9AGAM|nr:hypothetical protein BS47DRAFT_1356785 [Hydnum rufescens UP504]KAF9504347.1 hypothetical protein BS47DRAFT_1355317 [Hydnum rufescens UP504]